MLAIAHKRTCSKGAILDRSLSAQVPTVTDLRDRRPSHSLFNFNSTSQDYGEYFAGFPWTLFGCGTYRKKPSIDVAGSLLKRYFRVLGKSIGAPVAYIALPERRTSGCGYHPIPLHWHFLAARPSHFTAALLRNAQQLWTGGFGNAAISLYDVQVLINRQTRRRSGLQFPLGQSGSTPLPGPQGPVQGRINNSYIPAHAKGLIRSDTLALRDNVTKLPVAS
jgi:hypothetical protein